MINNQAWRIRLDSQIIPKRQSYNQFIGNSLIIGLGDSTVDVFDEFINRILDTGMDDSPTLPSILHINLKKADSSAMIQQATRLEVLGANQPANGDKFSNIVLEDERSIPSQDQLKQAMWQWLSLVQRPANYQPSERYAGRIILHKHLSAGQDAPLAFRLRNLIQRYNPEHVFIVASALDKAGASLIGDIAALVRAVSPGNMNIDITALVMMEEGSSLGGAAKNTYQTLTLYELAQISNASRATWRFSSRFGYNMNRSSMVMLNGALCIYGQDTGKRQVVNLLWSILSSDELRKKIYTSMKNIQNAGMGVNLHFNHSAIWNSRDLRELLANQLVLDFIGRAYQRDPLANQSFNINDTLGVNQLLDSYREYGLLPSLQAWRERLQRVNRNSPFIPKLNTIIGDLQAEFNNLEQRIQSQRSRIGNWRSNAAWSSPVDNQRWKSASYPPQLLTNLRNWVGWTVQNIGLADPLQMSFAPGESNQRANDELIIVGVWQDTVFSNVQNIVRTLVHNSLATSFKHEQDAYSTNTFQQQSNVQRFPAWRNEVSRLLNTIEGIDFTYSSLNSPKMVYQDGNFQNYEISDTTFVFQGLTAAHVPVSYFKNRSQLAWLRNDMQYASQRVLFDLFVEDGESYLFSLPQSLQDCLAYPKTLKNFYEIWKRNKLADLSLNGNSWESRVSDFIGREISANDAFARLLNTTLQAKLPKNRPALPSGDAFADGLGKIFQRFDESEARPLPDYFN